MIAPKRRSQPARPAVLQAAAFYGVVDGVLRDYELLAGSVAHEAELFDARRRWYNTRPPSAAAPTRKSGPPARVPESHCGDTRSGRAVAFAPRLSRKENPRPNPASFSDRSTRCRRCKSPAVPHSCRPEYRRIPPRRPWSRRERSFRQSAQRLELVVRQGFRLIHCRWFLHRPRRRYGRAAPSAMPMLPGQTPRRRSAPAILCDSIPSDIAFPHFFRHDIPPSATPARRWSASDSCPDC